MVTFGLGRTNTFLDSFAMGAGVNTSRMIGPGQTHEGAAAAIAATAGTGAQSGGPTSGSHPAAGYTSPSSADPYAWWSFHAKQWVSLVPNGQVVVFPYPPERASEWSLELFVAPSQQLLWVCVSWAAMLTLLAIVIAALHVREQREDEKEKRKHQLLFSF